MTNRISRKYQYPRKKNGSKRRSRWNESAKYRNRTNMNNMTGGAGSWDCTCGDHTNVTNKETGNDKSQKLQKKIDQRYDNSAAVAAAVAAAAAASSLSPPPVQQQLQPPVQQQFQLPIQQQFQLPIQQQFQQQFQLPVQPPVQQQFQLPVQPPVQPFQPFQQQVHSNEQLQQQINALQQNILANRIQQSQSQQPSQQDILTLRLQQENQLLQQLQLQQQQQDLRSQPPPQHNLPPAIVDDIGPHNTQVSSDSEVDGQTLPSQPMLSSQPMRLDMTKLQHSRPELFRSSQGNPHAPQGVPTRRVAKLPPRPVASYSPALNSRGDLSRNPQSSIIPPVQHNGKLNIDSNDLTFDNINKRIRIKKSLNLSRNPNETFFEGDEITVIDGTSLRDVPQVDLTTFKELTAGKPHDQIVFNVSNRHLNPSIRDVTIELKIPPPPISAGIRRPDLRNKGGYVSRGGKKTTIRRKKQKKRKNTKKRKVMVGGVLPEGWGQYSIIQKLAHATSNWKLYDQNDKIRVINELPNDNDSEFKRRLEILRDIERIDIGRDNTSSVLELINSKLSKESGPGPGTGTVRAGTLSPRTSQIQPDIASVILSSPRSNSGSVSPLASSQSTFSPRKFLPSELSPRIDIPLQQFTDSSQIRAQVDYQSSAPRPIGQPPPPDSVEPDVRQATDFVPQPPSDQSIPPSSLSQHHLDEQSTDSSSGSRPYLDPSVARAAEQRHSSESIPPPESPLSEEPSSHNIGLRGSPHDRPHQSIQSTSQLQPSPPELQPQKSEQQELQPPNLLASFISNVDTSKKTTSDIIDLPIEEPPEQRAANAERIVVCRCVPKSKKSIQPSSSRPNLTKTQRMKKFAAGLLSRKKTEKNKE
jgi:hypothetical protein